MNIKTAIVSVFDKTNIVDLCKFLVDKNVRILSTGGTYNKIKGVINSPLITEVSATTNFPEILNGRVKTLHPKIHGALLAKRDNQAHMDELAKHGIDSIDMVVTNLYPFKEVLKTSRDDVDLLMENIDIGGHTLIRAAAKNYKDVVILTNPHDYAEVMNSWDNITNDFKRRCAMKAFHHACEYDMEISGYFNPDTLYRMYTPVRQLKYGTNPQQQKAGLYRNANTDLDIPFEVLNGNPGYINLLDATYSWNLVMELSNSVNLPAVASFKHNSPAGVGVARPIDGVLRRVYFVDDKELTPVASAYVRARNVDPMSSFGDFLAVSHKVDLCTANLIATEVSDGIVAPDYEPEALEILCKKKKGGFIVLKGHHNASNQIEIREMHGLTLVQEENTRVTEYDLVQDVNRIITDNKNIPDDSTIDLIVANTTLKYTQSNSVCSAKSGQVLGVGAGQQSRIDCVKLVKRKTVNWYMRQHPKVIALIDLFKPGTKKSIKINAVVRYIENDFTALEYDEWLNLFTEVPDKLTDKDKEEFVKSLDNVSLASDAFIPFRDNIDVSSQFGIKYLIQPGGSVADNSIIKACNDYGMTMVMSGSDMRMFLH